jgi:hypothetical protein
MTHNTKKIKKIASRIPHKMGVISGKQFLLLIRHPPYYSYLQASPVKVFAVMEGKISH